MCGEGQCNEPSEEPVDGRKKEGARIEQGQQERGTHVPHTITLHEEIKENINTKSWLLRNYEVVIVAEVALFPSSIIFSTFQHVTLKRWEMRPGKLV